MSSNLGGNFAANFGPVVVAAAMLGASGCGPSGISVDTETGSAEGSPATSTETTDDSSTVSTTTSDTTQGGSTETDDGSMASDSDNMGISFYAGPDTDWGGVAGCDPWQQDCPEGEKCVPYGSTGGNWDANKCVIVTGDGQPGDPCIYGGTVEATDDCDATSHCWDVMDVDGMPIGTCTSFCQGTPEDPICPDNTSCLIANNDSINLCIAICDPTLQDCDPGLGCFWNYLNSEFNCIFTTQDIPDGEPCGFINDCAAGLYCADQSLQEMCAGPSCCTAFCDLAEVDPCPDMAEECVAFVEVDETVNGNENVGVCIVPP